MRSTPPPIPARSKRLTPATKAGLIILMIAFAALSIFAGWHLWLHSKIQRRLAAVRGAHEPVTLKELNQYYPEPPARSNAAFVYGQAFAVITNSKSYKVLEKLNELPPDSDPLPPDLRKQMEQAVAENQATLAKLDIAAGITTCRYPIDYASGWNTLLPHLSQLSACSSLQLCQGVIREQRGDINGAIDSLALILRFSASLDCEPDLVSLLTQYKLFRHANELLCWILNHNEVSQVDLNRLQTIFDSSDSTARLQQALVAERCMILDVFNQTPRGMLGIMDPQSEDGLAIIGIYFLKITGKLKQDEIRFLDRMSDCSQTLRLRLPERLSRAVDLREEITREGVRKKFILTGIMVPAFFKGI